MFPGRLGAATLSAVHTPNSLGYSSLTGSHEKALAFRVIHVTCIINEHSLLCGLLCNAIGTDVYIVCTINVVVYCDVLDNSLLKSSL